MNQSDTNGSVTTVTRGLSELKTIKKRLAKLVQETTFMSTKVAGQAWRDHIHETQAKWQAIGDLLSRYERLKFAIIMSNAQTKVTINGRTYTVAEAIAMKEVLQQKRAVLDRLRYVRNEVDFEVHQHDFNVREKLDRLLELNFKGDRKTSESDIKTISEAYLKNNAIAVVDPLKVDQQIVLLDQEIDHFTREVDFALSESNALTQLQV